MLIIIRSEILILAGSEEYGWENVKIQSTVRLTTGSASDYYTLIRWYHSIKVSYLWSIVPKNCLQIIIIFIKTRDDCVTLISTHIGGIKTVAKDIKSASLLHSDKIQIYH